MVFTMDFPLGKINAVVTTTVSSRRLINLIHSTISGHVEDASCSRGLVELVFIRSVPGDFYLLRKACQTRVDTAIERHSM